MPKLIFSIFEYSFWWNYLAFSNEMGLIIRKRMINNGKHRDVIYLKFGDSFFHLPSHYTS